MTLELRTPRGTVALSHVGPDGVVTREPVAIPPCAADVAIRIDGREHVWAVVLPDGVRQDTTFVATSEPATRASG